MAYIAEGQIEYEIIDTDDFTIFLIGYTLIVPVQEEKEVVFKINFEDFNNSIKDIYKGYLPNSPIFDSIIKGIESLDS